MRSRNGRSMVPWIAGALILMLVTLAGCAEVEVVDSTPAVSTPETFTSPVSAGDRVHNLAVLAVDFDPPLDYQQLILRRQSVALLVAIENTGNATERDVTVRARLSMPKDPDLLLTQSTNVASIAPGEIQVVRFTRLGKIPYHEQYRLEIWVDPVDGESDLGDNQRTFNIQIHQEGDSP